MANTTTLNETLRSPIDGTEYVRLATAGANWKAKVTDIGRVKLTANISYYVSTTGSDSNGGTNSSTDAWATLQHAMDFIAANIDLAGFFITVNIGAGTFIGISTTECVGGGIIQWNGAGKASTTLKNSLGGSCFSMSIRTNVGHGLDNVTVNNLGVPNNSLLGFGGGLFVIGNAAQQLFGIGTPHCDVNLVGNNIASDIAINGSGGIVFTNQAGTGAGITISGSFLWVIALDVQGQMQQGAPWVLSGGPSYSVFAQITDQAMLSDYAASYTGAGTGQRFFVGNGGNINNGAQSTGALGPNLYPGTIVGVCDAVSQYDGFPGPLPGIDTQTGASYTLAIGDAFEIVEMNNAGANTVTVPTNASVGFEIGTKIQITQIGAGATTISAAGGVTVHNAGALSGQWGSAMLYKRGTNEWVQTVA